MNDNFTMMPAVSFRTEKRRVPGNNNGRVYLSGHGITGRISQPFHKPLSPQILAEYRAIGDNRSMKQIDDAIMRTKQDVSDRIIGGPWHIDLTAPAHWR